MDTDEENRIIITASGNKRPGITLQLPAMSAAADFEQVLE